MVDMTSKLSVMKKTENPYPECKDATEEGDFDVHMEESGQHIAFSEGYLARRNDDIAVLSRSGEFSVEQMMVIVRLIRSLDKEEK